MSFEDFARQLNEEGGDLPVRKTEYDRQRFTCESCNGSGLWRGGRQNYRGNAQCNACNGQGYFVTSKAERMKAAAQRKERKQNAVSAGRKANQSHDDGNLHRWLAENASWNDFARSLIEQNRAGRAWSDNQVAAAERMRAKCVAKRAAKAEAQEAAKVEIDLSPIIAMFETALASGYKKPMYRAEGIRIKPGKGGSLYVLNEERMEEGHFGSQPGYEGKILDGMFQPGRNVEADTPAKLQFIAEDPLEAAIRYGQKTGRCACCGRELTKHASIDRGIGPICAEKWGF